MRLKIEKVGDPKDVADMYIISDVNAPFPVKM